MFTGIFLPHFRHTIQPWTLIPGPGWYESFFKSNTITRLVVARIPYQYQLVWSKVDTWPTLLKTCTRICLVSYYVCLQALGLSQPCRLRQDSTTAESISYIYCLLSEASRLVHWWVCVRELYTQSIRIQSSDILPPHTSKLHFQVPTGWLSVPFATMKVAWPIPVRPLITDF